VVYDFRPVPKHEDSADSDDITLMGVISLAVNNIYYVCNGNTRFRGASVDESYSREIYLHERGHQIDNLVLFLHLQMLYNKNIEWHNELEETSLLANVETTVVVPESTDFSGRKELPGVVLMTMDMSRNERLVKSWIGKIENKIIELNDKYHEKYGHRGNPWTGKK
jgi:hypothetical protein